MDIEIRHARVVASLVAAGSISKAAATLGLPQPSLTAQLRRIEKALGGELFVRSNTGITPTPLGRRLIPLLEELTVRADEVIAVASSLSAGVLCIGAEWNCCGLPPLLRDALPYWEVRADLPDPMAAVHRGAFTAALVHTVPGMPQPRAADPLYTSDVVVREPLCVALPAGRGVAALDELPWVRHASLRPVEQRVFAELGFVPKVRHEVDRHAEAVERVRKRGAAAIVPPSGATRDIQLVPLDRAPRVELVLLSRRGALHADTRARLVRTLRAYYCRYAAELPDYWDWLTARSAEFPELTAELCAR